MALEHGEFGGPPVNGLGFTLIEIGGTEEPERDSQGGGAGSEGEPVDETTGGEQAEPLSGGFKKDRRPDDVPADEMPDE